MRVRFDVHTPTAVNAAASKPAPTYCAIMTPACKSAPNDSPTGIGNVNASANHTNTNWPRYFPIKSCNSVSGCAKTTSMVPVRMSSANERIVTAGTKNKNSHGSKSSIGRSEATRNR